MTSNSSSEDDKSKVKIKATTGAWWKSTGDGEDGAQPEKPVAKAKTPTPRKKKSPLKKDTAVVAETVSSPVDEVGAEKAPVSSTRAPRKAKPKTTVPKKPTVSKKTTKKVVAKVEEVVVPASQNAEVEGVVPAKKPVRKRPVRKRSISPKKNAPTADDTKVEAEGTPLAAKEPVSATAKVDEGAVVTQSAGEKNAGAVEKPVRKRPVRRRKPRAAQPPKVEAEELPVSDEVKAVSESQETVVTEATEVVVAEKAEVTTESAPESVERKRPNRRRPRRGRKRKVEPTVTESVDGTVEEKDSVVLVDGNVAEVTPELVESHPKPTRSVAKTSPKAVVAEEKPKIVRLLINAEEPEECRLALLEDGRLESIHLSTVTRAQTKSNIYKAKIVAIEPNLQAAFVDYGTPKNGFLPFSEIHPEYYKENISDSARDHIENGRLKRLKIEDVVERGQELLVQVVKEEVGKKGANMTTYLSLPGRCVVLMPGSDSAGISRKISGEERRGHLRDTMRSLGIPDGIGWIVRTASVDITESALSRDVTYLLKLWEDVRAKGQAIEDVGQVYEDHRSVMRFLREHYDPSIQEILVDDLTAMEQVNEFVEMLPTEQKNVKVRLHRGSRPIFNQFSIEDQIESIYQPQVNLPSGGSIVIDPTEALVAIDVNSGSTSKGRNFDESIYTANMEAASELARQLRLRDLGGLIVVDFIDMRNKKHIRDVEREVKVAMKRDKAKVDFSRISKFGLMQISRQKLGSPIEAGAYRVCEHCKGRGTVRTIETHALFYLRRIQTGASRKPVVKVECRLPLDVASYLLNNKRHELHEMENKYDVAIIIIADSSLKPAENDIVFHKQEKEENV